MHGKYPSVVVGLDFSGDARVNDAKNYLDVLHSAKDRGLFVTVHLAEVPNVEEVANFLSEFRPHRVGHGSCIHPDFGGDDQLWKTFVSMQPTIPVEICLTSNLVSFIGTVSI
jgi:adenosine deaminase